MLSLTIDLETMLLCLNNRYQITTECMIDLNRDLMNHELFLLLIEILSAIQIYLRDIM